MSTISSDAFPDIDISNGYLLQIPFKIKEAVNFAEGSSPTPLPETLLAENIDRIFEALGSTEQRDTDDEIEEVDKTKVSRPIAPIALENIGVVIAHDLNSDQLAQLEAAEIEITPNFWVPSPNPVERFINQLSPDHLHYINIGNPRRQRATGAGVRIGIADTGIDTNHPEFAGKNILFAEFSPFGQLIGHHPYDAGDHGTHVAALAAGLNCGVARGADLAVAGVLMQRNMHGQNVGSAAQILAGVNWLLQGGYLGHQFHRNAHIINLSLGALGYNNYLYQTISVALRLFNVLTVAAIGNDGPGQNTTGSPGNYDVTFSVGATDYNDQPAPFSAWGQTMAHPGLAKPEMAAPGVNIVSAMPGGGYQAMSGTSMACPLVAGTAALLLETQPQFANNAVGLAQQLLRMVAPMTGSLQTGAGRLDLS